MNSILLLYVEGATEKVFYEHLLAKVYRLASRTNVEYKIVNLAGQGGFQRAAIRHFYGLVKYRKLFTKHKQVSVALCWDTDVGELWERRAIDEEKLIRLLQGKGVNRAFAIKARQSIEDWFLLDLEGVLRFLGLPAHVRPTGTNGVEKLKNLFRRGKKEYYKGVRAKGFIEQLDLDKIIRSEYQQLLPLFEVLGVKEKIISTYECNNLEGHERSL